MDPLNKESLIDYDSEKIQTQEVNHCCGTLVMKCYGSTQVYRDLWTDATFVPVELSFAQVRITW